MVSSFLCTSFLVLHPYKYTNADAAWRLLDAQSGGQLNINGWNCGSCINVVLEENTVTMLVLVECANKSQQHCKK